MVTSFFAISFNVEMFRKDNSLTAIAFPVFLIFLFFYFNKLQLSIVEITSDIPTTVNYGLMLKSSSTNVIIFILFYIHSNISWFYIDITDIKNLFFTLNSNLYYSKLKLHNSTNFESKTDFSRNSRNTQSKYKRSQNVVVTRNEIPVL